MVDHSRGGGGEVAIQTPQGRRHHMISHVGLNSSRPEALLVDQFHRDTGSHRPLTTVRLLYDAEGIYVCFEVHDRFVRCVHTQYQDPVSRDSCVEWFVQPRLDRGYFNFETNCGGTLLLNYCEQGKKAVPVEESRARKIVIHHSQPERVDPEIVDPVDWWLSYFVPFTFFEQELGPLGVIEGQTWRANFYKCGSETSHPHWASWSPTGEKRSFHQPELFGEMRFGALVSATIS